MRQLLVVLTVVLGLPASADWSIGVEGGGAQPLTKPQSFSLGLGVGAGAHYAYGLGDWLDVTGRLAYIRQGALNELVLGSAASGLALFPGVRARTGWGKVLVPTLELNLGPAVTGDLVRLAGRAQAGLAMRLPELPHHVGVGLGYLHFFRLTNDPGFLEADAGLFTFSLTFEFASFDARGASKKAGGEPGQDDQDLDGIPDASDRCPQQAEDKDGVADDDGCPETDADMDGVLDQDDQCPLVVGPAASGGCPDSDQDGVPDPQDACPLKAGDPKLGGCPAYNAVTVTPSKLEIKQKVFFAFGKTSLLPRSYPLLDEVAQVLVDRVGLCVLVEGHTDSVGQKDANLTLSSGRAEAIVAYLVGRGVKAARLTSQGFGQELPIDSNATLEGRENNRRVEFSIVPCQEASP